MIELQGLFNALARKKAGLTEIRQLLHRVAEIGLREWDFTDADGEPLPATPENLTGALDFTSATVLVTRYLGGLGVVPPPLGRPSANGISSEKPPASSSPTNSPALSSSS